MGRAGAAPQRTWLVICFLLHRRRQKFTSDKQERLRWWWQLSLSSLELANRATCMLMGRAGVAPRAVSTFYHRFSSPLLAPVLRVNNLSPFLACLAGGSPALALLGSSGTAPHLFVFSFLLDGVIVCLLHLQLSLLYAVKPKSGHLVRLYATRLMTSSGHVQLYAADLDFSVGQLVCSRSQWFKPIRTPATGVHQYVDSGSQR